MMKLLTLASTLALSLVLSASEAGAQEPGLSVGYHQASSNGQFGVHLQLGARAPRGHRRGAQYSSRHASYRRGSPTWTYQAPAPRRVWMPGHYQVVQRKHWVPGSHRQVWVPARYETRYDWCGRRYTVLVSPGHYQTIQDPGHWEYRSEKVWIEAHWETRP